MPIENIKHGKYIVEMKPGHSIFKEVTAAQLGAFGTKDLDGDNFCLGWSLLTQPFKMVGEAHKHDYDQYIFFMGGDPAKVNEFDAEIEFGVDNKMHTITYPACIRIPAGTMHGPLNVKKVNKPCMFIDIVLSPGPSVRPIPKDNKPKK
jgi:hypothetical protein